MKKLSLCLLFCLLCVLLTACISLPGGDMGYHEPTHTHNYTVKRVDSPTCTDVGMRYFECDCGDGYEEEIASLGGDHAYVQKLITSPTCITDGLEKYTCSRCNDSYDNVLDAEPWNHDHGDWVITLPATAETVGERVKTCKTCDAKDVVEIPVTAYTDGLSYLYDEESNSYWVQDVDYLNDTVIKVPPTYKGLPVRRIVRFFEEPCDRGNAVTEVIIPNSVVELDNCCFANLPALQKLSVPFVGHRSDVSWQNPLSWCFGDYQAEQSPIPESLETVTVTNAQTLRQGSFKNCTHLKRVILAETFTAVESRAFLNCPALEAVVFPDSMQSFGNSIFDNCPALTHLTLPFIGRTRTESFWDGLSALFCEEQGVPVQALTLTATDALPARALISCAMLTDVTLPVDLKTVGDQAFVGCSSLTAINLPDGVTSIGECAFMDSALTQITLPTSLTKIGESAFENLATLTAITFPPSAARLEIGNYAFRNSGLQTLTLPSYVALGIDAFYNCDALETLTLHCPTAPSEAFAACDRLTSLTLGEGVIQIEAQAFERCASLEQITLGSSVELIGYAAFRECAALSQIHFAENGALQTVGALAFAKCTALERVTLPNTVTAINYGVFSGCDKLGYLSVPFVGPDASNANKHRFGWFFLHSDQTPIDRENGYIPQTLKTVALTNATVITENAFFDCFFEQLLLNEGLLGLDRRALYSCNSLTELKLPSTLSYIEAEAIGSSSLTELVIPDSVTYIARGALETICLQSITLPFLGETASDSSWETSYLGHIFGAGSHSDQLQETGWNIPFTLEHVVLTRQTTLWERAFANCIYLKSITLPDTLTGGVWIDAFSNCPSLQGVEYENGIYLSTPTQPYFLLLRAVSKDILSCTAHPDLRYIASAAFKDCWQLSEVTVAPNACIELPADTFANCRNLASVTLANVHTIRERAFMDCTALQMITLPDTLEYIYSYAFSGAGLTTVTIPYLVRLIGPYAFACPNLLTAYFSTTWDWSWADGWYEYGPTNSALRGDPAQTAYWLSKEEGHILDRGMIKKTN